MSKRAKPIRLVLKLAELRHALKTDDLAKSTALLAESDVCQLVRCSLPRSTGTVLDLAAAMCQRDVFNKVLAAYLRGAKDAMQATLNSALREAAWRGRTATVNSLLELGADPCAADDWGSTAVHRAAARGRLQALEALLQHVTDFSLCQTSAVSPLTRALLFGRKECAEFLVRRGFPADIFSAILARDLQTIELLLKKEPASRHARMRGFTWGMFIGPSPLALAVLLGDPGVVEVLSAGAPGEDRTENGFSSLSIAAFELRFARDNNMTRPGFLPSYGSARDRWAVFDQLPENTKPDLAARVAWGDRTAVRHALAAKPVFPDDTTGLAMAVCFDAPDMVEEILAVTGPATHPLGPSSLSLSVFKSISITQRLLEAGMPPNDEDALYGVLRHQDVAHLLLFLQAGADPNLPVFDGFPLHLACDKNASEVLAVLIDAGAHVSQRDTTPYGFTPLHRLALCLQWGFEPGKILECVRALRSAGADFSVGDSLLGATAQEWLHYACFPRDPQPDLLEAFAPAEH